MLKVVEEYVIDVGEVLQLCLCVYIIANRSDMAIEKKWRLFCVTAIAFRSLILTMTTNLTMEPRNHILYCKMFVFHLQLTKRNVYLYFNSFHMIFQTNHPLILNKFLMSTTCYYMLLWISKWKYSVPIIFRKNLRTNTNLRNVFFNSCI